MKKKSATHHLDRHAKPVRFSESEKQVLILVALGMTDDEIGTRLKIQRHTLMERIQRVLDKIGAKRRLEILFYGYSEPKVCQEICARSGAGKPTFARGVRAKIERKAS